MEGESGGRPPLNAPPRLIEFKPLEAAAAEQQDAERDAERAKGEDRRLLVPHVLARGPIRGQQGQQPDHQGERAVSDREDSAAARQQCALGRLAILHRPAVGADLREGT